MPPQDAETKQAPETLEEIADRLAGVISHGAMDDHRQSIKEVLAEFANEIIRRAIEP